MDLASGDVVPARFDTEARGPLFHLRHLKVGVCNPRKFVCIYDAYEDPFHVLVPPFDWRHTIRLWNVGALCAMSDDELLKNTSTSPTVELPRCEQHIASCRLDESSGAHACSLGSCSLPRPPLCALNLCVVLKGLGKRCIVGAPRSANEPRRSVSPCSMMMGIPPSTCFHVKLKEPSCFSSSSPGKRCVVMCSCATQILR